MMNNINLENNVKLIKTYKYDYYIDNDNINILNSNNIFVNGTRNSSCIEDIYGYYMILKYVANTKTKDFKFVINNNDMYAYEYINNNDIDFNFLQNVDDKNLYRFILDGDKIKPIAVTTNDYVDSRNKCYPIKIDNNRKRYKPFTMNGTSDLVIETDIDENVIAYDNIAYRIKYDENNIPIIQEKYTVIQNIFNELLLVATSNTDTHVINVFTGEIVLHITTNTDNLEYNPFLSKKINKVQYKNYNYNVFGAKYDKYNMITALYYHKGERLSDSKDVYVRHSKKDINDNVVSSINTSIYPAILRSTYDYYYPISNKLYYRDTLMSFTYKDYNNNDITIPYKFARELYMIHESNINITINNKFIINHIANLPLTMLNKITED